MSGPGWLADGLAGMMIATAVYCAYRLAISHLHRRDTERDADGLHVLMGVAMAGMLQPRLTAVPAAAWSGVFAAGAAWFAWRAISARVRGAAAPRCAHAAPHAIESAAMVYMFLPIGSWRSGRMPDMAMPGMSQGATIGNPAITVVLALFMLGYTFWAIDRLAGLSRAATAATAGGTGVGWPSRPAVPVSAVTVPATASVLGRPAPMSLPYGHPPGRPALAPRGAACYKIAMAITMGYMLVMML